MPALRAYIPLALLAALPACSGPKNFHNENDDLRRRVLELTTENTALRSERDELALKLQEADRVRLSGSGDLAADAAAALPRCIEIEIGALSGPVRPRGSTLYDAVDVYVRPLDGRQRFVQAVGRLIVRADLLPAPGDSAAPTELARADLGPSELREAYRSGITGTHYSIRMPISPPRELARGSVALSVEFHDALTGAVHSATTTRELTALTREPR